MKLIFSLLVLLSSFSTSASSASTILNDIHSQLNPTSVREIHSPRSIERIQELVRSARERKLAISISGGRHSMGGQQFGEGTLHLSMTDFNRILSLDEERGLIEVESGIQWPEIIEWLSKRKSGWAIRQKQTGADRLSIGGALSSNIHGRGLKMRPMIDDVESFTLVDANGDIKTCSRKENVELFRLAIGGYGLFGIIGTVKLRLSPLTTLKRVVRIIDASDFVALAERRINEGFRYGDFQFAIDPHSREFMKTGVASLYQAVPTPETMPEKQKELSESDWLDLIGLAHADKKKAFEFYSKYYLSTDGQLYQSDTHQLGVYLDDYHRKLPGNAQATEMISEIYVPRSKLGVLFRRLREDFRRKNVNVIYGTVRLIEKDRESFLAWAKEDYAAIVFNFHVEHDDQGIKRAKREFRLIIDRALELGGSYFLTYHSWATRRQVLRAYPQMPAFLRLKKKYDPEERFQSEWYRHHKKLVAN